MFILGKHQGMILLFVVMCTTSYFYAKDDITKELYRQHYKPFEATVFTKRAQVEKRKIPFVGHSLVEAGARTIGYDDYAIKCIPFTYPLLDRTDDNLRNLLRGLESDICMQHANLILKRSREKPGDLNWIVRVTHEEGNRLEQEKIKKTGRTATQQEKDEFIAIGLFIRYLVKNKHI